MILNKTKILATIGPACSNQTTLQKMVDLGVNAFRINMSHGSIDDKKSLFKQLKKLRSDKSFHPTILADFLNCFDQSNPPLSIAKIILL